MLHPSHWNHFFTHLLLWAILYYLMVGLFCYHQELFQFFHFSPSLSPNHPLILQEQERYPSPEFQPAELALLAAEDPTTLATFPDPDVFRVELLIDQLHESLSAGEGQERTSEQMKVEFQKLFLQFPDLKDSPFEPAINEFLYKEALHHGFDFTSEGKIEQLWRST